MQIYLRVNEINEILNELEDLNANNENYDFIQNENKSKTALKME
jgi:hypothetical protein